jgi:1-acyl-sn-glycerol-3-phosphate acyltransferase
VIRKICPPSGLVLSPLFSRQNRWLGKYSPSGQVLFIGSHNGGLAAPDMFMMMYDWFQRFGSDRLVYGLMDSSLAIFSIPSCV